jgi:hypothetical protein
MKEAGRRLKMNGRENRINMLSVFDRTPKGVISFDAHIAAIGDFVIRQIEEIGDVEGVVMDGRQYAEMRKWNKDQLKLEMDKDALASGIMAHIGDTWVGCVRGAGKKIAVKRKNGDVVIIDCSKAEY